MRNDEDIKEDIDALAIILYELHYERNKNIGKWTSHQKEFFLDVYGLEKTQIIGTSIQNYFEYSDFDLLLIHPRMRATLDEREIYLKFLLDGFIQSGFLEKNQNK